MKSSFSLKTKTFSLLMFVVVLATAPLILYSQKTAQGLSELGSDPVIEKALSRAVEHHTLPEDKATAIEALKKYRQIQVLKRVLIVKQVFLFSLVYSLLVVIVSLVVGYFFISRITRPLQKLTEATGRLAAGQLDFRIREKAGGEVGLLVDSFNRMADDLSHTRDQLAEASRRATWQQVARTLAHEIKNPLTPIKLSTERMYDKFLSQSRDFPEVIKSTTQTVLSEIANLQKLVDTFHRYAKFPDPVLRPVNPASLLTEAVALFNGAHVPVAAKIFEPLPDLMLDFGQMKKALTNLAKNGIEAVETVERPGFVNLSVRESGGTVEFRVEDNGCGIPAENREKLFQPYFTTKTHGNGIGLALTERIVSLNGGRITVESQEGKGTVFTLIFIIRTLTGAA